MDKIQLYQCFGGNNTSGPIETAAALNAKGGAGRMDFESETLVIPILEAGARTGKSTDDLRAGIGIGENGDPMFTLQSGKQHAVLAFDTTQVTSGTNRSNPQPGDPCHTLAKGAQPPAITTLAIRGRGDSSNLETRTDGTANAILTPNGGRAGIGVGAIHSPAIGVRRLTPLECERLQGFPDNYTAIKYRGKPAADGPRYKALGNSMALPCIAWIGNRIRRAVESQLSSPSKSGPNDTDGRTGLSQKGFDL